MMISFISGRGGQIKDCADQQDDPKMFSMLPQILLSISTILPLFVICSIYIYKIPSFKNLSIYIIWTLTGSAGLDSRR